MAVVAGGATLLGAQDGAVRVTAARANLRAEASDTAPVLAQVPAGTDLVLKSIDGDWFRVQMPPDPRLAGVRVEAYISKKVARLVAPPGASSAVPATTAGGAPGSVPAAPVTGMSVALKAAQTTWLTPETARVRLVVARVDSFRGLSGVITAEDPPAPPPGTAVTFALVLPGAASSLVVSDRQPAFVVQYTAVPGIAPADIVPDLVRLAPAIAGVRIVGAIAGAVDLRTRTAADWEVMRDWRQESMRPTIQIGEPGTALVQARSPLEPGQYAVVLRPTRPTKIAPSTVFTGPAFLTVWTFSVR